MDSVGKFHIDRCDSVTYGGAMAFRHRYGLTLIEIMIALTIFAVGVLAVMNFQMTVSAERSATMGRVMRSITYSNVANLIEGTPWDELGTTTSGGLRDWSLPRLDSNSGTGALTVANLKSMRIVSNETGGLFGIQGTDGTDMAIAVEYYRSISNLDANGVAVPGESGLFDNAYADSNAFKTAFAGSGASMRLTPSPSTGFNGGLVTLGNPIIVRIVVRKREWNGTFTPISESWSGAATAAP